MTYRIAFFGPPGAGKGTQAELLASVVHVPIIGPGALYRKEIAAGTDIGKRIAESIAAGKMAPNEVTNAIVEQRLRAPDCASGYIFDGYPREAAQQEALDRFAPPLTHAILLDIPAEEIMARLAERLVCVCGKQFNRRELAIDPGDEARCVACDGTLERRKDDNPESIRERIAHYHAQTEPVINAYRERGVLVTINGRRSILDVHRDILAKLDVTARD